MEPNKLLTADFLDILFERMNKDYGAYQLRKNYSKRLRHSLLITAGLAFLAVGGIVLQRILEKYSRHAMVHIADVDLMNIKDRKPPPPVIPPPPPRMQPPRIEIRNFTVPHIVEHVEVQHQIHDQDSLNNVTIGHVDQSGIRAPDVVNPPKTDDGSRVTTVPADDDTHVFTKVEIEAQFRGDWNAYVRKAITEHIDELQDAGQSGTCEVRFIVDQEGNVSDVEALTMQGTKLAEIAIDAIKRGPKWEPAQQNGRKVKAFRSQKITFQMQDQ